MKIAFTAETSLREINRSFWELIREQMETSVAECHLGRQLVYAVFAQFLVLPGEPFPVVTLETQVSVDGLPYRLDFLLTVGSRRIAFEADGFAFHRDQASFARDRKRDRDLAAAGIETYRYTALELENGVDRELRRIIGAVDEWFADS